MGGFARTRIGTQLASCIDLDEVVETMLNEICNNLEFGVVTKVFNDGIGSQKDTVRQE